MSSLKYALKMILPLLFSYFFLGVASGLLLQDAGYGFLWAFLSAALIYAGSMQFVMISLLQSGAPLLTIALTALFINARHMFYGISFIKPYKRIGGVKAAYMALTMTDEVYSVLVSAKYPEDTDPTQVNFFVHFLLHSLWILSCVLGNLAGEFFPINTSGIEFSATALFITIVLSQWKSYTNHFPALAGGAIGLLCLFLFGPSRFLLPALIATAVILIVRKETA